MEKAKKVLLKLHRLFSAQCRSTLGVHVQLSVSGVVDKAGMLCQRGVVRSTLGLLAPSLTPGETATGPIYDYANDDEGIA